jgi:hypothetical protein
MIGESVQVRAVLECEVEHGLVQILLRSVLEITVLVTALHMNCAMVNLVQVKELTVSCMFLYLVTDYRHKTLIYATYHTSVVKKSIKYS